MSAGLCSDVGRPFIFVHFIPYLYVCVSWLNILQVSRDADERLAGCMGTLWADSRLMRDVECRHRGPGPSRLAHQLPPWWSSSQASETTVMPSRLQFRVRHFHQPQRHHHSAGKHRQHHGS